MSGPIPNALIVESRPPCSLAVPVRLPKPKLLAALRRDAARYARGYVELGFWIGATYRFGVWANARPFVLRVPLSTLYRIVNRFWRLFMHVNISVHADIGPGLCLVHPFCVMIPATTIGEDALIFHEVTLGSNTASNGFPKLGNGVAIFAGARVLGGIEIGDEVQIGANCVVTSSIKPRSIVAAAPNRVLCRDA